MHHLTEFEIEFAPEAVSHFDVIEHKYHRLIQKTIREQLAYTPEKETRNRKPLKRPTSFGATWELRLGPGNRFRVFYQVNSIEHSVWVLAIGIKERNQLWIGGEEFDL